MAPLSSVITCLDSLQNAFTISDKFFAEANWPLIQQLETFCAARGRTLLELAFSWLLAQPVVGSVVAGATRPEQLEQNAAAAAWTLTAADLAEINQITAPPAT